MTKRSRRRHARRARRARKEDRENEQTDVELGGTAPEQRFYYEPRTPLHRLCAGLGLRTALAGSAVVQVRHRSWVRWGLALALVLLGVFLTPELLPHWLGFRIGGTPALCEHRDAKLSQLQRQLENATRIHAGRVFLARAEAALLCMNDSAAEFWQAPYRVSFPSDCVPANVEAEAHQIETCKEPVCAEACLSFIIKRIACHKECTKRTCIVTAATDPQSQRKVDQLLSIVPDFDAPTAEAAIAIADQNATDSARARAQDVVKRLMRRADLAGNMYILYALVAVGAGVPVVVQKRGMGSRVLRTVLGMRQPQFVLAVLAALLLWDVGHNPRVRASVRMHLANFRNDPCYLDAGFARQRLSLIAATCANTSAQQAQLHDTLADMSRVIYTASLCEVSKISARGQNPAPALMANLRAEQALFAAGNASGYMLPSSCNATQLEEATRRAPETGHSFLRAFLGSAALAQALLKAIVSSWLVHVVGCAEPLALSAGKVEVFGLKDGEERALCSTERNAVKRFARDKHIVPLVVFSVLLLWVISVLVVNAVRVGAAPDQLFTNVTMSTPQPFPTPLVGCEVGKLVYL